MNDNLKLIRYFIESTYDKVNNLIPIVALNPGELRLYDIDGIKLELGKALALIKIEDNDTEESDSNTESNKDDLHEAIRALNEFTHNYCMNCAETEESGSLVFRCKECLFSNYDGFCSIKAFANIHDSEYTAEIDFGCMH